MARALLITNPIAARTNGTVAADVERVFRAAGWSIEAARTSAPGDARLFAEQAAQDGVDVVAVLGGDGTSMQAAAALVGTEVTLGLVPGGTGNVLAGNLRVPNDPTAASELILRGRSRRIDVGRIARDDGIHYFAVACGAGADARIMGDTATASKRRWGIGGYFATLFRVMPQIRSTECIVTIDGVSSQFPAALALVLNCGEMIPPLVRVRREANPEDGVLDLIVLSADSVWECFRGLTRVFADVAFGTKATPYLSYRRGQEITIEMAVAQPVQYDGDLAGMTPITTSVVPKALRVMVP